MKHWISAFRLRTLPLALASIFLGSLLAYAHGSFRPWVIVLCMLTTLLLQVLSNLANDYGDTIHGADSADRLGPMRMVQAGYISKRAMLRAMVITGVLAFFSGIGLLLLSFGVTAMYYLAGFTLLGLAAIWAAVSYTAGSKPYGYAGFGDVFVFLFFGPVGTLGSYFLQSHQLQSAVILPAAACGLLATGVLNVNNLRDLESDRKAGKRSVPVRVGPSMARIYHAVLVTGAFCLAILYVLLHYRGLLQWLFLLVAPLFAMHIYQVVKRHQPYLLDPLLKQLALLTLAFVLLFGLGQVLTR